jgi:hypothetical protein
LRFASSQALGVKNPRRDCRCSLPASSARSCPVTPAGDRDLQATFDLLLVSIGLQGDLVHVDEMLSHGFEIDLRRIRILIGIEDMHDRVLPGKKGISRTARGAPAPLAAVYNERGVKPHRSST